MCKSKAKRFLVRFQELNAAIPVPVLAECNRIGILHRTEDSFQQHDLLRARHLRRAQTDEVSTGSHFKPPSELIENPAFSAIEYTLGFPAGRELQPACEFPA